MSFAERFYAYSDRWFVQQDPGKPTEALLEGYDTKKQAMSAARVYRHRNPDHKYKVLRNIPDKTKPSGK